MSFEHPCNARCADLITALTVSALAEEQEHEHEHEHERKNQQLCLELQRRCTDAERENGKGIAHKTFVGILGTPFQPRKKESSNECSNKPTWVPGLQLEQFLL